MLVYSLLLVECTNKSYKSFINTKMKNYNPLKNYVLKYMSYLRKYVSYVLFDICAIKRLKKHKNFENLQKVRRTYYKVRRTFLSEQLKKFLT